MRYGEVWIKYWIIVDETIGLKYTDLNNGKISQISSKHGYNSRIFGIKVIH